METVKKDNNKPNYIETIFIESWHPYAWIIGIGFVLYLKTLFFGFVYFDDNVLILDNFRFLKKIENIFQAFRQQVFHIQNSPAFYYRPLLTISFMLDAQIGSNSPWIYHFTNLILHLLSSCLLFVLLIKLKYNKELALLFSLIFTVHPVLTQAVAWIPGRNDSLLAVVAIISLIYFINFSETKKRNDYFWHLSFFALAVLTKESAILLILIYLFYHKMLYIAPQNLNKKIKELPKSLTIRHVYIGWVVLLILWFFLRKSALGKPTQMSIPEMLVAVWENSPAIILFIGKIVLPVNLSVLPIIKDSILFYGMVVSVLLIIILVLTKNKRYNFITFGILWFLFFLLPSFIRPNEAIFADFIEHRVYLPIVGLIILLLETNIIKKYESYRKEFVASGAVIILIFSVITFTYSDNFQNRIKFWENAARTSPHSPLAHRNLGAMYYLAGLQDKAEPEYRKALELNPTEQMVHNNLGLIYMNRKMYREAEIEFKRELEINPRYDNAHFNLGLLYFKVGQYQLAEYLWKKTIEVNPEYVDAYYNLAAFYYSQKNFDQTVYYVRQLQKLGVNVPSELLKLVK